MEGMREEDASALAKKPERRIAWARGKWGELLAARAAEDHSCPEGADPLAILCNADPTAQGIYLDWLCRVYSAASFLLEDVERVRNTLILFDRWKHRLPVDQRDVGRHRDEHSVWMAVERFDPTRGEGDEGDDAVGREKRRRERARALAESEVFDLGDSGWIMASPKTHFAARWWGRGTRWCTSMVSPMHFSSYTKNGPLFVFVDDNGDKFQIHLATGSCADAADRSIPMNVLAMRLPEAALDVLRPEAEKVERRFRQAMKSEQADQEFIDMQFKRLVQYLPPALLTKESRARLIEKGMQQIETLVEDGGWRWCVASKFLSRWVLGLVHEDESLYLSPVYCMLESPDGRRATYAVKGATVADIRRFARLLLEAPLGFRDKIAIDFLGGFEMKKRGYTESDYLAAFVGEFGVSNVPREAWLKLAKALSKKARDKGHFTIPAEVIDDEIADILAGGFSLRCLPEEMRTRDRLKMMLTRNPEAIDTEVVELGLEHMVDEDVAFASACRRNGECIARLSERFVTKEFCDRVLRAVPHAVVNVPERFLDLSICLEVVRARGDLVKDLPAQFLEVKEIWDAAVLATPEVISRLPHRFRDDEICMRALEKRPAQFIHSWIPLPYELYKRAVAEGGGSLLARVPLEYRDLDMCFAAVEKCLTNAAPHIPPKVAKIMADEHGLTGLRNWKLSPRYPKGDPIYTFMPSGDRPERLLPLPSIPRSEIVARRTAASYERARLIIDDVLL